MEMPIKEQLEYGKKVIDNSINSNNVKNENNMNDDDYLNVINTHNNEVYNYFASTNINQNSLTQCTQPMWYRLYLEKKRLQNLGLRKEYSRTHPVQHMKDEDGNDSLYIRYENDGKNFICKIRDERNHAEKFCYINAKNRKIGTFCGKARRDYIIVSSKFRTKDEFSCPNCGATMRVDQLIDGCDYCHTKFTLQDLKSKISSQYESNSNVESRRGAPLAMIAVISVCFLIPRLFPLAIILMLLLMLYVKNNGQKTTDSLYKLEKNFGNISEEALFSDIENKLFTLHYCDNATDLEALCSCDLGVNYGNVLLCSTEKYFIENVEITPNNMVSMECRFHLKIKYLKNQNIQERKEIVKFRMIRSSESLREIKPDFLIYKCKKCGSSLSLLNGGTCQYCRTKMDLENFDWKVVEYHSDWI